MSPDDEFSNPRQKPKPKPEVDRGGSGRPPRKTALAYFGDAEDDDSFKRGDNFKKFQKVVVQITGQSLGGFDVQVVGMNVAGRLKTNRSFTQFSNVEVVFKEWSSSGKPVFVLSENESVDFLEGQPVLKQLDPKIHYDTKLKFKRESDILPLPVQALIERIDFEEININKFLKLLNDEAFTGFITFSSIQLLSRGFFLMHKGLCVGCHFSSASNKLEYPTEDAIKLMLDAFVAEDAVVQKCPRDEEIVVALSAAYMGKLNPWEYDTANAESLLKLFDWFKFGNDKTGLILIASDLGSCFAYFYNREFIGCFQTETQSFTTDEKDVFVFLSDSVGASIQHFILPMEGAQGITPKIEAPDD